MDVLIVPAILAVIALALIAKSVLVVPKGTSVVFGKLGRADRTLGPGLHIVVPFITSVMARLPAGEQELDVPAAAGQLRDGTGASVRGTVRYRMADAAKAMNDVADYRKAVAQLASTHWLRGAGARRPGRRSRRAPISDPSHADRGEELGHRDRRRYSPPRFLIGRGCGVASGGAAEPS